MCFLGWLAGKNYIGLLLFFRAPFPFNFPRMKTIYLAAALLATGILTSQADQTSTSTIPSAQPAQNGPVPKATAFRIVGRGANSRDWQREEYEKLPDGTIVTHVHKVTEIASGMNFQINGQASGQWVESKELIEAYTDGSIARQGSYQVIFANNLNSAGAIDMQTPDGKRLRSNILGLAYFDHSSGQSVMIAQIQDSQGEMIADNQVLYPSAFTGVNADVRYTYKRGSFGQDVILKEQLPTPESVGLSSDSTELQVMTEFLDPPQESIEEKDNLQGELVDQTISWGAMVIGHGRAFDMGDANDPNSSVSATKQYVTMDGRKILLEKIPVQQLQAASQGLPKHAGLKSRMPRTASHNLAIPPTPAAPLAEKPMKMAATLPGKPGFILDYMMLNAGDETNFTFQGDTTYLVSGDVNLSGTTAIEGGTVIKFDTNNACAINILGTVNCRTASYRPAVFTSTGDSSVGEEISGSSPPCTGTLDVHVVNSLSEDLQVYVYDDIGNYPVNGPIVSAGTSGDFTFTAGLGQHYAFDSYDTPDGNEYYLDFWPTLTTDTFQPNSDYSVSYSESGGSLCTPPASGPTVALALANGGSIHDVRISNVAVGISSQDTDSVENAQFVNCGVALKTENASLFAGNVLMSVVGTAFLGQNFHVTAENLTFDQGTNVTYDPGTDTNSAVTLVNSLLTEVSSYGSVPVTTNFVARLPSNAGVYQAVGAGNYYLPTNSVYRGDGTASIDSGLLAMLATKTTYPPFVYSNTNFTNVQTFSPRAQRDTNATPDYGFHYDVLDFVFGNCYALTNVTFTAGTRASWFDSGGCGFALTNSIKVNFNGTATAPCVYAHYSTVQEENDPSWTGYGWVWFGMCAEGTINDSSHAPLISANFTHFYCLAAQHDLFRDYTIQLHYQADNCEFYSLGEGGYGMWHCLTNCLLDRVYLGGQGTGGAQIALNNCTMHGGTLLDGHWGNWPTTITNCAFDGTDFEMDSLYTYCDYNAFVTNDAYLPVSGAHDVYVTNFNWQPSWFGHFYLPPGSPLIDHGSTNANLLGLYHLTTQTNQAVEGNSIVDLGCHFIATDQYGNPLDSNGDGIPDYLEDANGDGLVDNGETNWALAILVQPASQTVLQGSNVTFSVTAQGVNPLHYQWYDGAAALTGATNVSLTLTNVQGANDGNYYVCVSNSITSSNSAYASLVVSISFVFTNFCDVSSLQINTNAVATNTADGCVLELTLPLGNQSGDAFLKTPVYLGAGASFSTFFSFRLSQGGGSYDPGEDGVQGADGITFMVQTLTNKLGGNGGGLGYVGTTNSVAVEFDTYYNFGIDPYLPDYQGDGNHVGVDLDGSITSAAHAHIVDPMNNGNIWYAWIDYNGSTSNLEVRLSEANSRPAIPVLAYTLNILDYIKTNVAYVGFSAGTGGSWNQQDILTWQFVSPYNPIGTTNLSVTILSPTNQTLLARSDVTITAFATNSNPNFPVNYVQFFVGTNSIGYGAYTNGTYQFSWFPVSSGTDVLTALAVNTNGLTAWSSPVMNYVRNIPTVSIINPTNGQLFIFSPTNITIQATATADRSAISNVVFYAGTNILGSTNAGSPFTFLWNTNNGAYSLTARATDTNGAVGASHPVGITVNLDNQPPQVYAGPNQTTNLPTAQLNGFVSDDGLPSNYLAVTWSEVSGPTGGIVTFGNTNQPFTTATFNTNGTYVLQLFATDGQSNTTSDVTINVLVTNLPPVVYAGTNHFVVLPAVSGTNLLAAIVLTDVTGEIPSPIGVDYYVPSNCVILSVNYSDNGIPWNFELVDSNGQTNQFSSISNYQDEVYIATVRNTLGSFNIGEMFTGNGANGQIMRIEPDGTLIGTNGINSNVWVVLPFATNNGVVITPGHLRGGLWVDQTSVWGGDLIVSTLDGAESGTDTHTGSVWRVNSSGQATFMAQLVVPNDGLDSFEGITTCPNDPRYGPWAGRILVGGDNQNIYAIDTNGQVVMYDLGIGDEDIRVIPGNQNFFAADSAVKLWGAGASEFQGMVGDLLFCEESSHMWRVHWTGTNFESYSIAWSQIGSSEEVNFTPAGIGPIAPIQNYARMDGAVSDDGRLFTPTINSWTEVSGPALVTFDEPNLTNTLARFTAAGTYDLRLSAYDGQFTTYSDVSVNVTNNHPPVVSAGTNFSTPTLTGISLNGSVSDDGLPYGVTNIVWQAVLGPTLDVTFGNSNAAATTLTVPQIGIYVLQLTASDGQVSSSAEVTVTVGTTNFTLSPAYPTLTNTPYTVTAKVVDSYNNPVTNLYVSFQMFSPYTNVFIPLDNNGNASFTYVQTSIQEDTIEAILCWGPSSSDYILDANGYIKATQNQDWVPQLTCGLSDSRFDSYPNYISLSLPTNQTFVASYCMVNLTNGQTLSLDYTNISDTILILHDPSNQVVLINYGGIVKYIAQSSGSYLIEMANADGASSGHGEPQYTISLDCGGGLPGQPLMYVLANGTNYPSGQTLVFPTTTTNLPVSLTLLVTNYGINDLLITNVSLTGDFTNLSGANFDIPAETSTNIVLQFNASSNEICIGQLLIQNNGLVPNFILALQGSAFIPGPLPNVRIVSPPNGFTNFAPATFPVVVTASSTATNINYVDLVQSSAFGSVDYGTNPVTGVISIYNTTNLPTGTYTFQATAVDVAGRLAASAAITVQVAQNNETNPPVATNDQFHVLANSVNNILEPLTNDTNPNPYPLTITSITAPEYGSAHIVNNGTAVAYTPQAGIRGYPGEAADGFHYTVSDRHGGTATAIAYIYIDATDIPTIDLAVSNSPVTAGTSDPIYATNNPADAIKVDFYQGQDFIGEATTETGGIFALSWTASYDPNGGGATISASATDQFGQVGLASPITVNVTAPANGGKAMATLDSVVGSSGTNYFSSTKINLIRDGMFQLYGRAYHNLSSNVTWQVGVYAIDGTFIRQLSPLTSGTVGTSNAAAQLLTCDLTTLMNGTYDLRLTVNGGYTTAETNVEIQLESNLKIGQFSFSQQDLIIPVSGIPLSVTRTYNSLNLNKGDFGYGWTYALADMNASLDETRVDTNDMDEEDFSLRNGGGWDVTLTLPNGQVTTFAFNLVAGVNGTYAAEWDAAPGVTAKLGLLPGANNHLETLIGSVVGNPALFYWDAAGPSTPMNVYDFPGFVLTNLDGTRYILMRDNLGEHFIDDGTVEGTYVQAYGDLHLTQIVDRNGNTITINPNAITYNNATNGAMRQIQFQRNDQNLITSISDPEGLLGGGSTNPAAKYDYDASDNLIDVQNLVDRNAGTYVTNSFSYTNVNFPHYVTGIISADGTQVAQNFYDDTGKLIAVQDANGNLTQFINNPTNNMDVIIDRNGFTNTYVYDLRGNVIAQTNQLGQITEMAYDANNNKTNVVTFLGSQPYATNSYLYDTNLNVLLVSTDPLGHTNSFAYDSFGNVLTNTDARGNSTINTYDNDGNLTQTTDAASNSTYNVYGGGLLLGLKDAVGTITTNYYDGSQNLFATATLDTSGTILSSNTITYDDNANRITSTVWRHVSGFWTGATTAYVYDAMNRVVQTINPDGGTNTVVDDPTGKQQATIDPLGRTTSYVYDRQGRLVQTIYPAGTSESSAYDTNGNRTNSVDRNGNPTTYVYDALNRLVETAYADGSTNATVYDGVGRTAQTIDALGNITAFSYDAAGRRLAVTNAVGTTVQMVSSYGYDANGNQIMFTDANNHNTMSVFDPLNRQVQTQYADGTTNEVVYDANGRKVAATNQDGIVTLFGYDGTGRLTSVTNAVNKAEQMVTRYQYDEMGNETLQIDGLGRTNSFGYDGQGRRVSHTMPTNGLVERFSYDLAGNMVLQTNFSGGVITNEYDANNRLTSCSSARYAVTYTYTVTGQRQMMNDPSGVTTYTYDNRDRLLTKTVQWNQGPTMSLNYSYNLNGSVTNIWSSTSGGVNLQYAYDPLSRLTNVLANGSAAAGYAFDSVGNLQKLRYGNAVTNFYQYDALSRLTNMVWKTNGTTIASFAYQLGLTGNRTSLTETNNGTSRTYAWSYDNLYRLTNEVMSGLGFAGYRYDTVGNRLNRSSTISGLATNNYAYTANDWLTNNAYDLNGNTITNAGTNYQYDVMNHLVNLNNGQVVLAYNGDGDRVLKIVGGVTNYYLVDDRNPSGYAQVLEEHQGATLSRWYNYGMDLVSQIQPGSVTNYYSYDGHGSVRFLTGLNGVITDTYTYDAYGSLIAKTGTTANNYLYSGQQFDPDLGFYYNRARYVNTDTGRFLSMDSNAGYQEDPQSLHKYLYGADNPVNLVDPNGQNYYFGGNPGASFRDPGHFWVAVDSAVGGVDKYDYGLKDYAGPGGSWGTVENLYRAKAGPGQANVTPCSSISQAARTDKYYEFNESPYEDSAMYSRMIISALFPAEYHLFTHNCGHASFEIAQQGWPVLAPTDPYPAAFLRVVQTQWPLRKALNIIQLFVYSNLDDEM